MCERVTIWTGTTAAGRGSPLGGKASLACLFNHLQLPITLKAHTGFLPTLVFLKKKVLTRPSMIF